MNLSEIARRAAAGILLAQLIVHGNNMGNELSAWERAIKNPRLAVTSDVGVAGVVLGRQVPNLAEAWTSQQFEKTRDFINFGWTGLVVILGLSKWIEESKKAKERIVAIHNRPSSEELEADSE